MTVAVVCVLLALVVLPTAASAQVGVSPEDEQAVRAVVARYVEARERRDAAAIGALFTADADQFTTGGEWRRGREAIVQGTIASSERTEGRRRIAIRTVRMLAPGIAVADGPYEIADMPDGGSRQMWTTFLLTRDAGQWRIAAIRNALPSSIPDALR